jgi:ankyrin repeat protein
LSFELEPDMDDYDPNPEYLPPKANEPALHRAARVGDVDAIRTLVAQGSDLNAAFDLRLDPDARAVPATPLMVAAGSGDGASVATVEVLIALGAPPTGCVGGRSAARFAAGGLGWNYRPGGDAARLRLLVRHGCDLKEVDARGVTLVAEAACTGDVERVRVLLEAGALPDPAPEVQTRSDDGVHQTPWTFQSPVHLAAEAGSAAMLRLLLAAGANSGMVDNQQRSALFCVSSEEALGVLLAAGLNLEARDCYGWSPLDSAVSDGDVRRVRMLLAAGANIGATHDRGYTVFMSAVSSMERSPEMLRLLVDAGADPHAVTELGWTAFHAAIDVNGAEANAEASVRAILTLLRDFGVDINHADRSGTTPLDRARAFGTRIEARVLEELGARASSPA